MVVVKGFVENQPYLQETDPSRTVVDQRTSLGRRSHRTPTTRRGHRTLQPSRP